MVALRRNSQTKLVAVGDSWRALTGWVPVAILLPHPPEQAEEGWHLVTRHKQWRKIAIQAPSPQQPHRSVPANLVGRCFNCLHQDHVAAGCPNATCCFRCHREGHYVRVCMKPRSPDTVGPSQRAKRPPVVAVLHPWPGDVALGHPRSPPRLRLPDGVANHPTTSHATREATGRRSTTPPSRSAASTADGSPSCHTLPSPPPSASPLGAPRWRPQFETRVIPRTTNIDAIGQHFVCGGRGFQADSNPCLDP
jgi:hypothetical protein